MNIESQATNISGNTFLATGSGAGVLGVLSENYDIVMMSIAFAGLIVGTIFKYLHYRMEKKKNERSKNNK